MLSTWLPGAVIVTDSPATIEKVITPPVTSRRSKVLPELIVYDNPSPGSMTVVAWVVLAVAANVDVGARSANAIPPARGRTNLRNKSFFMGNQLMEPPRLWAAAVVPCNDTVASRSSTREGRGSAADANREFNRCSG